MVFQREREKNKNIPWQFCVNVVVIYIIDYTMKTIPEM